MKPSIRSHFSRAHTHQPLYISGLVVLLCVTILFSSMILPLSAQPSTPTPASLQQGPSFPSRDQQQEPDQPAEGGNDHRSGPTRENTPSPELLGPRWNIGDYWVTYRTSTEARLDDSDDGYMIMDIQDFKKMEVIGIEDLVINNNIYECYKLELSGDSRSSADGVTKAVGYPLKYHYDYEGVISGEVWITTADLSYARIHAVLDGDLHTDTVLGDLHQHQDTVVTYDPPLQDFGFPVGLGDAWDATSTIETTGFENIDVETDGDEPVHEIHNTRESCTVSTSTETITVPDISFFDGSTVPLEGKELSTHKFSARDNGSTDNDPDSIDPPGDGFVETYYSHEVGFYARQRIKNMWVGMTGLQEYVIESDEYVVDFSYSSAKPAVENINVDSIPNDGKTTGSIVARISDPDGSLELDRVTVDLTAIGGNEHSLMYDDGTHGDEVPYDLNFTIHGITTDQKPGEYPIIITVRDKSGNIAHGYTDLVITDSSDQPPVVSDIAATPDSIKNDGQEESIITVTTTDDDRVTNVTIDLTSIGGPPDQPLFDDATHGDVTPNDDTYTVTINVSGNIPSGSKNLDVTIRDSGGNKISRMVHLTIVKWNSRPVVIVHGIDPIVNDGMDSAIIEAEVTDPDGNLEKVGIDLSPMGKDTWTPLHDDGKGGDKIAGDGTYSIRITVPRSYTNGSLLLTITAQDSAKATTKATVFVPVIIMGQAPVISNWEISTTPLNGTNGLATVTAIVTDSDNNLNKVILDLSSIGLTSYCLMLFRGNDKFESSFQVPVTIKPGNYSLTMVAYDFDNHLMKRDIYLIIENIPTDDKTRDTDNDNIPDWWEMTYGLDPFDPSDALKDYDNDMMNNFQEYLNGGDPFYAENTSMLDTDGDRIPDVWELEHGLDPNDPFDGNADPDNDGYTNYQEYRARTDPFNKNPGVLWTQNDQPENNTSEGDGGIETVTGENSVRSQHIKTVKSNIILFMVNMAIILIFTAVSYGIVIYRRPRGNDKVDEIDEMDELNELNELIDLNGSSENREYIDPMKGGHTPDISYYSPHELHFNSGGSQNMMHQSNHQNIQGNYKYNPNSNFQHMGYAPGHWYQNIVSYAQYPQEWFHHLRTQFQPSPNYPYLPHDLRQQQKQQQQQVQTLNDPGKINKMSHDPQYKENDHLNYVNTTSGNHSVDVHTVDDDNEYQQQRDVWEVTDLDE